MNRRLRVLVAGLASSSLVFAAFATAARTVVSATGTLVGSGTTYTLTVRNTSTASETISCIRYFAPAGTTIVSVTGLAAPTSFGTGFGAQNLSLAPGASSTYAFTTNQPITSASNGALRVSTDCVTDVAGTISGPISVPTGGSGCACTSLSGQVVPKSVKLRNPRNEDTLKMEFTVAWSMSCVPGTGGCVGELVLTPPQPSVILKSQLKPLTGRIDCVAACGVSKTGVKHFTLVVGRFFGHDERRGKSLRISVGSKCQGKAGASQSFVFAFNKAGLVDKRKSKFK